MKYTISETTKTVTVETTEADGKVSLSDMEKAVKRFAKMYVDEPAPQALTYEPTAIDETPDPLEGIEYPEVAADLLADEFRPANILAAE